MFLFTGNHIQISNIQHLTANLNHQTAVRRLANPDFTRKGINWEGDNDEAIKVGETEMTKGNREVMQKEA